MSYSMWEHATTKHGIEVDEAVSALQKCIRRAKEEDAVRFAYELYITAMGQVPEVPDIALDKHTRRGREMGRDSRHFYEEGCLVFPQAEVENDYRARYGEVLKEYSPDKVEDDAFQYAVGRF